MIHGQNHSTQIDKYLDKLTGVFILIWFIAFAVFLPGAKAGIVGDIPYLIDAAEKQSFWDFINIEEGTALYHTAALNFYVLIKLFGTNYWLWHMLYVTIHAVNGLLLFVFMHNLLHTFSNKECVAIVFNNSSIVCYMPARIGSSNMGRVKPSCGCYGNYPVYIDSRTEIQ